MAKSVSRDNKSIAKMLAAAFGGTFSVVEFVHDSLPLTVDLLRCENRPGEGVTATGTIGLSDTPLYLNDKEYPVRVELVGAIASGDAAAFASVLGTAAFCIMRSQSIVHPGSILEDAVSIYFPETTLPHLYFTAPFLWENQLRSTELETKKVAWLLAFPISKAELAFLREKGSDALEGLFEQRNIDMFDLQRESVV